MVKIVFFGDKEDYECQQVTFEGGYLLAHTKINLEEKVRRRTKVFQLSDVVEILYF